MGFLNTVKHFLGFESEDDYYDDDYYDEEETEDDGFLEALKGEAYAVWEEE